MCPGVPGKKTATRGCLTGEERWRAWLCFRFLGPCIANGAHSVENRSDFRGKEKTKNRGLQSPVSRRSILRCLNQVFGPLSSLSLIVFLPLGNNHCLFGEYRKAAGVVLNMCPFFSGRDNRAIVHVISESNMPTPLEKIRRGAARLFDDLPTDLHMRI